MINRYYGQWSPPVDQVLYENYFKNTPKGFFVDCGASDGALHSCTKFFEDNGWDGICIEPSVAFKNLVLNRKVKCLNSALSNKEGTIVFSQAVHPSGNAGYPAGGSANYPKDLKNFVGACGYQFADIKVPTITYKSLGLSSVDLMTIDVEGHEEMVLAGMVGAVLPKVICIEYTVIGLKKSKRLVTSLGYRFDFISFNNAFFSIGLPVTPNFGVTQPMGCFNDE